MLYNILKRENGKLILTMSTSTKQFEDLKYSYSQIPMTTEDVEHLVLWLTKNGMELAKIEYDTNHKLTIDPEQYPQVLQSFMRKVAMARENGTFESVPNKVFDTDIQGTSALLRNKEKTCIKIVRRKEDKTKLNKVCISNGIREQFFNDCKKLHGLSDTGNYCIYYEDGKTFEYWSNMMDNIYYNLYDKYTARHEFETETAENIFTCQVDERLSLPQARECKNCGGCKYTTKCWSKKNKEFLNKTYHTNY